MLVRGSETNDPDRPRAAERLSDLVTFSLLLAAPLAVGVVHPATWFLLTAAVLVAWALALKGEQPRAHPALLAFVGLSGFALLTSLVPLPDRLLGLLSPAGLETWHLPPSPGNTTWHPVHQAPAGGTLAVLRWVTAAGLVGLAAARLERSHWKTTVQLAIVAGGALAMLDCVVQTALGWDSVLGLYLPRASQRAFWLAPILNENNWAAYLTLIAAVSFGLIQEKELAWGVRALLIVTGAMATLLVLASPSRGGQVGLLASGGVLVLLRWLRKSRQRRGRRRLALVGTVALGVLLAGLTLTRVAQESPTDEGELFTRLEREGKSVIWREALDVIGGHPLTGVGRGAFGDVSTRTAEGFGRPVAVWVENLPLQLLVDHGVLMGGALALLLLLVPLLAVRSAARHPERAGAAAALVGLAVHELADFALAAGAVLLPTVLLAVVALHSKRAPSRTATIRAVGVGACALLLLWTVPRLPTATLEGAWQHVTSAPTNDELERRSLAVLRAHPSSFVFAQDVALEWLRRGEVQPALVWLNRAQLLAPGHPDPHVWTARTLLRLGLRSQALGEFKLALERAQPHDRELSAEVLSVSQTVEDVLRGIPEQPDDLLARVALDALAQRRPFGPELARVAAERAGESYWAGLTRAAVALAEDRTADAAALLEPMIGTEFDDVRVRRLFVRQLYDSGLSTAARDLLRRELAETPDDPTTWLTLGLWAIQEGDRTAAVQALQKAREGGVPRITSRSLCEEGWLELESGSPRRAVHLARRASLADPTSPRPMLLEAEVRLREGRLDEARALFEHARALAPTNVSVTKLGQRLESATSRGSN